MRNKMVEPCHGGDEENEEAANAKDYTIFAAILYEEILVIDRVGEELVVM